MIYIKKILISLFILPVILFSLTGCTNIQGSISASSSTTAIIPTLANTQTNNPSATNNSAPSPPMSIEVSFPKGVPPLNQASELSVTIKTPYMNVKDINLKVDLPEAFELVSGELSWHGNVPIHSEIVVIKAMVKSVKLGSWTINVPYYITPEGPGAYGGNGNSRIFVLILENSAEWRINPAYPPPGASTLPPGQAPATSNTSSSSNERPSSPLTVHLSISKLPVLNEIVYLTCEVSSKYDVKNSEINIKLPKGVKLIHGSLDYRDNLSANIPKTRTIQIAFTETGKWTIEASASHRIDDKNSWGDLFPPCPSPAVRIALHCTQART